MPQIVWQTRPDGYHDYFNQRWYDYTGLTPAESLGSGWRVPLHPEDRDLARERWEQATRAEVPYEIEYRFRGRDGRYRWFLGRAVPYRDSAGRILCWFGTITDIDDQRREKETLEQLVGKRTAELSAANEALQRSNRELEQFAYVASHDLQEPLRKIQAFGDRLQKRCPATLGEQGQDYLTRMLGSATRMRRLIDDLLTFSRISTRPQAPTTVHLTTLAHEVLSDLEGSVQQTGGQVEIGPLPTLEADPLQMRQLLQNLIGNALKFHRPGEPPLVRVQGRTLEPDERNEESGEPGVEAAGRQPSGEPQPEGWRPTASVAEVEAAGRQPSGNRSPEGWRPAASTPGATRPWYEITVQDNGIGFEEVYLDRIFQVFQRLHGRNEYEGTGVGLAICRKIVERHGGRITARSAPGQGSTFIVYLPGEAPAPVGVGERPPSDGVGEPPPSGGGADLRVDSNPARMQQ